MSTKEGKAKSPKKKKKKSFFVKIKDYFKHMKKDVEKDNSSFSFIEVMIIIVISILFGIVVGYLITYSNSPFYRLNHSGLNEIIQTYHNIVDNYYGELDEDELSSAAIKGMVNSLDDPYSSYMEEDVATEFNETVDGSFVGIGVMIQYEEHYSRIIEVYEDSPASKTGLQVEDLIVKVDGTDVYDTTGDALSKLIRGKKDTKVTVTVRRGEEEIDYVLTRGVIALPSVHSEVFESEGKKIGYIKIDSFAANTYDQFKKALVKLEKDSISGLVLDVRDNPGGHLLQTKQILSMFFPKKTVLYQVETKSLKQKAYSTTKESRSYPVAVLINSSSASASEILASCFQENYSKAFIIGKTSYGKGTVQKSQTFSNGTSIKYTTQKWLTSKGVWFDNVGLTPDIEVDQDSAYYRNPVYENDAQLQAALGKLKES